MWPAAEPPQGCIVLGLVRQKAGSDVRVQELGLRLPAQVSDLKWRVCNGHPDNDSLEGGRS